jgi:predicted nucleic acid-binding protein
MAKYAVIYDACVLYPAPLRDLLLELAAASLFRAQWTDEIQEEWIRALLRERGADAEPLLRRTKELMNTAVTDANVTGYEPLISSITLPDANDCHVVAAAIKAKADGIVTFNLKHFPASTLEALHLEAIHPDDFISAQIDLTDAAVIQAATRCCRRLKNPPKTGREYLDTLQKQRLPKTVAALRPYEELICPSPAMD